MPTGQVIFELVKRHGKKTQVTKLGTGAVSGGAATLTVKPNVLMNQMLTIVYSGDPDFMASNTTPSRLDQDGDRKLPDLTGRDRVIVQLSMCTESGLSRRFRSDGPSTQPIDAHELRGREARLKDADQPGLGWPVPLWHDDIAANGPWKSTMN